MNAKKEIEKKYMMLRQIKKMIIVLGIITTLTLFAFKMMEYASFKVGAIIMMVISVLSSILFFLLWASLSPIKKHILGLISEYEARK